MPESTFWLLANGRAEEAKEILRKMAIYNGRPIPWKLLNQGSGLERNRKINTVIGSRLAKMGSQDCGGQANNGELKTFIDSKEAKMDKSHYENTPNTQPNQGQYLDLFRDPILRKHIIILSILG